MPAQTLSETEALAARMFFDVALQSAFALEDPNARFAIVFQEKSAMGPRVETLAEAPARTYEAEAGGAYLAFQVRPPNSRALSRVLVQGGVRMTLIRFLEKAMEDADYFTLNFMGSAEPLKDLSEHPTDIGNLIYRLAINPDLKTVHDVAVMFAWGLSSDKGSMMELSAWPIDKTVELDS